MGQTCLLMFGNIHMAWPSIAESLIPCKALDKPRLMIPSNGVNLEGAESPDLAGFKSDVGARSTHLTERPVMSFSGKHLKWAWDVLRSTQGHT